MTHPGARRSPRWLRVLTTIAAAGWLAPPTPAAPMDVLDIDKARSVAEFSVRAMWILDVHGRFNGVSGEVRIDTQARSAQVEARIDVRQVDMRRSSDEEWVKSSEFFDVARYPDIHFVSDPFPLAALDLGGDITGTLRVRNTTLPSRFRLDPSDCPGHAVRQCEVRAEGTISRAAFGMRSRRGILADKVRLRLVFFTAPAAQPS